MREGIKEIIFPGVLLCVDIFLWLELERPKYQQSQAQDYGFDSTFFPRILLGVWGLLCVLLIARALLSMKAEVEAFRWRGFFSSAGLTCAYIAVMSQVGFLIASIPFVAVFMAVFGYRNKPVGAAIAVIFPTLVWYVFVFVLNIPLPTSSWTLE